MQAIWKLIGIVGLMATLGFMLPFMAYLIPIAMGISAILMGLKIAAYMLFGRNKSET